jgi:hypothetical protein
LLGGAEGVAWAYVRTTTEKGKAMKWGHRCLSILLYAGSPPRALTSEVLVDAVTVAAASWSATKLACTQLELSVSTTNEASGPVEFDYRNRITFRRETWCKEPQKPGEPCYDPQALAITSVFARTSDGTILDADMEVNAKNFIWGDLVSAGTSAPASGSQDIQNAVTHELGHLIGLDHTCYAPNGRPRPKDNLGQEIPDCNCFGPNGRPPTNPDARCKGATARVGEATMFVSVTRGDTSRRDLNEDDALAACEIYPANGGLACAPPDDDDGGCQVGALASARRGTSSAPAWALLGLGVLGATLSARRRRARPHQVA